jgi:hypothetical protein
VTYLVTGVAWVVSGGLRTPEPLQPAEPYLAVLELVLLLSAPTFVVLAAAVHAYAPPDRRAGALAALALMAAFAALTGSVHFARLAVARHLPAEAGELSVLRLYPWPSVALALDFLAWDLFLGLALLLAAPVFRGGQLSAAVRASTRLKWGCPEESMTGSELIAEAEHLARPCVLLRREGAKDRLAAVWGGPGPVPAPEGSYRHWLTIDCRFFPDAPGSGRGGLSIYCDNGGSDGS